MACSAVVIELPNGVFITMMPFAVAALISTLSTPIPARPTTFRLSAAWMIFSVTFVAERIASPSYWPMTEASLSLSLPRSGSNVTSMPRSLKICTAVGESLSEMRTFGAVMFVMPFSVAQDSRRELRAARISSDAKRLSLRNANDEIGKSER